MKKITILFFCLLSFILVNAQVDSVYKDISQLNSNIIKIKPSSFFFGYTQITYERNISAKRSFEINLGLIGLGYDIYNRDPMGFALRGGYKFYFGNRKIKRSFMKGFYLMPEIAYCIYDKNVLVNHDWDLFRGLIKSSHPIVLDENGEKEYDRYRKFYGALIATVGYQWNIYRFVIEYNLGIGIGCYNITRENNGLIDIIPDDEHHFGFYGGNSGGSYGVISANLKIGYMF